MMSPEDALQHALAPLNVLRQHAQRADLVFTPLASRHIPPPYHRLLVHDRDMTQTLETFHGDGVHLDVQHSMHVGSAYVREVTLNLDRCGTPVEYGAIHLFLDRFSADVRSDILANTRPLGALLNTSPLEVSHMPGPFFSVVPDDAIQQMLNAETSAPLYGRCNMIRDSQGAPIAQVVEILPQVTHA